MDFFFEFLNAAVTPYHTVDALKSFFKANSFTEMGAGVGIEPGKPYFVCRGASIIAFRTPKVWNESSKFRIALAHTDFPTLKISPNPDGMNAGVCTLHTEVYGSPLYTSWLDRDLGYAGMLAYVDADFNALWACASGSDSFENRKNLFVKALEKELPAGARLVDFDVQLFDAQPANRGGFNDEWIYSGRLDNLSSCHAIAEAIVGAKSAENDCLVACFFNNEEVGSTTREGAASNFLKSVLDSIASLQNDNARDVILEGQSPDRIHETFTSKGHARPLTSYLAESLALSIDMAHAEHPNHTEKHEPNHAPLLGKGIVLKTNAQKRYASDLMSSAQLRLLCEKAGIPLQVFIMRNDMPCGSTVGPTVSANLGIPTVDIGEPMLSMHSIREMMAASDHEDMIKLVKALFC